MVSVVPDCANIVIVKRQYVLNWSGGLVCCPSFYTGGIIQFWPEFVNLALLPS